jgi:hypothetical protein
MRQRRPEVLECLGVHARGSRERALQQTPKVLHRGQMGEVTPAGITQRTDEAGERVVHRRDPSVSS